MKRCMRHRALHTLLLALALSLPCMAQAQDAGASQDIATETEDAASSAAIDGDPEGNADDGSQSHSDVDAGPADAAASEDSTTEADASYASAGDTAADDAPPPSATRQLKREVTRSLLGVLIPALERRVRKALGEDTAQDEPEAAVDPEP